MRIIKGWQHQLLNPWFPTVGRKAKEKAAICSPGVTRSGCRPEEITLCSGGHGPHKNWLPASGGEGTWGLVCFAWTGRKDLSQSRRLGLRKPRGSRFFGPDSKKEVPSSAYLLPGTQLERTLQTFLVGSKRIGTLESSASCQTAERVSHLPFSFPVSTSRRYRLSMFTPHSFSFSRTSAPYLSQA